MSDYSENDALNDYIAVELAQATARILSRSHDHVYIAMEVNRTIARIVEREIKLRTRQAESIKKDIDSLFRKKEEILELYWSRHSEKEIAEKLNAEEKYVQEVLNGWIPRQLIYDKYDSGMLPSRIGRLKAINLTTNCVRRVLNMDPIEYQ